MVELNARSHPYNMKGDGTNETSKMLQLMMDAKVLKKGVFFPEGIYASEYVPLYSLISVRGEGQSLTTIQALQSNHEGFIQLGDAITKQIYIRDLTIRGHNNNPIQNGFHFRAFEQDIPAYTGGLWYSVFKNIDIKNFGGNGILLRADDGRGDLANQFLVFENVHSFRRDTSVSRALRASGQLGQVTFINCAFDGTGNKMNTVGSINVELSRTKDTSNVAVNDIAPSCIRFVTCTFQESEKGVRIDRCEEITFDNCWFERLKYGVELTNSASGINFKHNHFANAASDGLGTGYGVWVGTNCHAGVTDNGFRGAVDLMVGGLNHRGIKQSGNVQTATNRKTLGIVPQIAPAGDGSLSTKNHTSFMLSMPSGSTNTNITALNSALQAPESLYIRVWGVGGQTITLNEGVISLPYGKTKLVCTHKDMIHLIRYDVVGAGEWVVAATTGILS